MGRGQELKVVGYLLQKDGPPKPITDLTPEEMQALRQRWSKELSRVMSDYYTQHPDEYRLLLRDLDERDRKAQTAGKEGSL